VIPNRLTEVFIGIITVVGVGLLLWPLFQSLPPQKIEGVTRIFLQQQGAWTLMVQQPDGSLETRRIGARQAKYIPDVPDSGPMWVQLSGGTKFSGPLFAEFHIRSEKDVDGGAWKSGKYASGQTVVIK
jgi:hypothetical protein